MKRIVLPAVAVAVLVIAGVWWIALTRAVPPGEPQGDLASSSVAKAPAPARSEVIAALDPLRATSPPLSPRAQPLRDQIRDATDLRALYERMKDTPDPTGERSYRLAEAIFECSVFADMPLEEMSKRLALTKTATENPRRQELFAFMVERCKGFSGNPAGLAEITQALHKRAEAAGYPAEIARSLRFETGRRDPDRADQVAINFLSNTVPDPDVVHELAQFLNMRNQGQPAWRGVDAAARSIGWGLLECDYGADCGPRSRPVVMTCIVLGACDLTRVEEAILAQGTQATVNNAMRVRETLARQIAARDWAGVGFTPRFKAP
jgi:hypothetical protein